MSFFRFPTFLGIDIQANSLAMLLCGLSLLAGAASALAGAGAGAVPLGAAHGAAAPALLRAAAPLRVPAAPEMKGKGSRGMPKKAMMRPGDMVNTGAKKRMMARDFQQKKEWVRVAKLEDDLAAKAWGTLPRVLRALSSP